MRLIYCLVLCILSTYNLVSANEPDYDEVARFNEVIQFENPLAVLFTEKCCKCTECVEAEVLLGGMSKELEDNLGILVVRLKKTDLRSRFGVKHVPALVYIRRNKTAHFDGKFEIDSMYSWMQENIEPATADLDDTNFEHLTQAASGATTGDWLVLFHDGSCCKKRELIFLENAGISLRNKANVASVNTNYSPETVERFNIRKCPTVIFFRHQKMYRFPLMDINTGALITFSTGFYVNSKAENVPLPRSSFDKFIEKIVQKIKHFHNDYWYSILVGLSLTTVFTTALLICVVLMPSKKPKNE